MRCATPTQAHHRSRIPPSWSGVRDWAKARCSPRARSSGPSTRRSRSARDQPCWRTRWSSATRAFRYRSGAAPSSVIGATVGDLCEIGNGSKLMPGARLGDRAFLGEGTVVPAGMSVPDDAVAVGRPARVVRRASADDLARLLVLRDGDLALPPSSAITVETTKEHLAMGQLYAYRGIVPTVPDSAVLFPTAEITGDVVIGERTIVGAGVKI